MAKQKKVSLVFVSAQRIKKLNHLYRKKNQITDILSFNYQTAKTASFFPKDPNFLGELVVCLERVQQQAQQKKHLYQAELTHILIHGILHLLGYDHQEAGRRQKMELKTEEILCKLKSKNSKSKKSHF